MKGNNFTFESIIFKMGLILGVGYLLYSVVYVLLLVLLVLNNAEIVVK